MKLRTFLSPSRRGFSRVELLAVLAALTLVATVLLPALAGTERGNALAACVNNLRQIGRAYQVWDTDHDGDRPMWVFAPDGIRSTSSGGTAWFQFAFISNQLATPRILACPSDQQKRVACDFGDSADGGFINPSYCNNAVSYFLGLHPWRWVPGSFQAGDRNVRWDGVTTCAAGVPNAQNCIVNPAVGPFWTNNLHGLLGSIVLYDGQVRTASNQRMTNILVSSSDKSNTHCLAP